MTGRWVGQTNEADCQKDGLTDGRTDKWTDGRKDERNGEMHGRTNGRMRETSDYLMKLSYGGRTNEQLSGLWIEIFRVAIPPVTVRCVYMRVT